MYVCELSYNHIHYRYGRIIIRRCGAKINRWTIREKLQFIPPYDILGAVNHHGNKTIACRHFGL